MSPHNNERGDPYCLSRHVKASKSKLIKNNQKLISSDSREVVPKPPQSSTERKRSHLTRRYHIKQRPLYIPILTLHAQHYSPAAQQWIGCRTSPASLTRTRFISARQESRSILPASFTLTLLSRVSFGGWFRAPWGRMGIRRLSRAPWGCKGGLRLRRYP